MRMRTDFEFSMASLAGNAEHFLAPRQGLLLGLGLTTACNYRCAHCFYHAAAGPEQKPAYLPYELLECMLGSLGRLALLNIALQGEPFLHPDFFEILELGQGRADTVLVCTNGSLLDAARRQKLRRMRSIRLAVSLDACDAHAYAAMRGGSGFEDILANLRGLDLPLELNFALCRQNMRSLAALPDLAASLGAVKVNLAMLRPTALTRLNGLEPPDMGQARDFAARLLDGCAAKGVALDFDGFAHASPCPFPFAHAALLADGSLFPCCGDFRPEPVADYGFDGIYNHPCLRLLRGALLAGKKPAACAKCMPC